MSMVKLNELIGHFEKLWPMGDAEQWDRPGLMIGDPSQDVSKVLLTVDVTMETLESAVSKSAQLVLSHHPMFLRGVTSLPETSFQGEMAAFAIRNHLAVFSAHTNADFQESGVSATLARSLGLESLVPLDPLIGQGVIGEVQPTSLVDFARKVARTLPAVASGIKTSGDPEKQISRVGLVAGAGDSFLQRGLSSNLDLFITSDLRHHPASDFVAQSKLQDGPALMDVAHWAAEWMWLEVAATELAMAFGSVEFEVSDINTDPWDFAVMQ